MKSTPRLVISLKKIEHNTKRISELAKKQGMTVTGVTKCCCGSPEVARAMLRGGVVSIADSRITNIRRLREAKINSELMLLRTPRLSRIPEVISFADISLNSELEVIEKLSAQAVKKNKKHKIVLMVEMGDLREGELPEKLESDIYKILTLKGINLEGIGMNLACYGAIIPTEEKIRQFSGIVEELENKFSFEFNIVSGGNSANIPLLFKKPIKSKINHLRIGEGILLGLETVHRTAIPGTSQDAFTLESELIEVKKKPSVPYGKSSQNVFGEKPKFRNRGKIKHGLLALGEQDADIDGLKPLNKGVEILGKSSDHTVLNLGKSNYKVGDILRFRVNYSALLHLFTSKYVAKEYF